MFIMAWRATWILGSGWLATGAVGVGGFRLLVLFINSSSSFLILLGILFLVLLLLSSSCCRRGGRRRSCRSCVTRFPPLWSLNVNLDVNTKRIQSSCNKVPNILEIILRSSQIYALKSCIESSRSISRGLGSLSSSSMGLFMSPLMLLRSHVLSREAIVGKHPLPSPSLHHGVKSGNSRGCPGSTSTTSIHGSKWSEQTTASGSKPTHGATLTSCLLLLLLLLLPLVQVLGSLLQCLHPLEQPLGKDVARLGDLHHVVTRVFASGVAGLAQVIVITDNTPM